MTSDEQRKAFEQWATSQQFCLERFDAVGEYMNDNTHFAWQAWQAAKQVKPLVFKPHRMGIYARTNFGYYFVVKTMGGYVHIFADDESELTYDTEAEAIEAANIDYRKRVLSCLVNGGV